MSPLHAIVWWLQSRSYIQLEKNGMKHSNLAEKLAAGPQPKLVATFMTEKSANVLRDFGERLSSTLEFDADVKEKVRDLYVCLHNGDEVAARSDANGLIEALRESVDAMEHLTPEIGALVP